MAKGWKLRTISSHAPCQGKNKAKGFEGCKTDIPKYQNKFGLCYQCLKKWMEQTEAGQEEIIKRSKGMYVTQKPRAVSKKRQAENKIYTADRKKFLVENTICFIDGCSQEATTIEHTKGRVGYADDYARQNKISLYLDQRFWKPCCLPHNLELERNPELSKKYQLSKIHNGKKI